MCWIEDGEEQVPRIEAPRSARWRAMARPMPLDAPLSLCQYLKKPLGAASVDWEVIYVTMAFLPARSCSRTLGGLASSFVDVDPAIEKGRERLRCVDSILQ